VVINFKIMERKMHQTGHQEPVARLGHGFTALDGDGSTNKEISSRARREWVGVRHRHQQSINPTDGGGLVRSVVLEQTPRSGIIMPSPERHAISLKMS